MSTDWHDHWSAQQIEMIALQRDVGRLQREVQRALQEAKRHRYVGPAVALFLGIGLGYALRMVTCERPVQIIPETVCHGVQLGELRLQCGTQPPNGRIEGVDGRAVTLFIHPADDRHASLRHDRGHLDGGIPRRLEERMQPAAVLAALPAPCTDNSSEDAQQTVEDSHGGSLLYPSYVLQMVGVSIIMSVVVCLAVVRSTFARYGNHTTRED